MTWARGRSMVPIVLFVLSVACGGDATGSSAASGSLPPSSSAAPGSSSPSPSPSPLVVPKDCSPGDSALEISAVNTSWADAHGHPLSPGEACLAVASKPFTVTLHNDVDKGSIGALNHNFAVFADPSASEALFTGDLAYPGTSKTYHVPKLPAGTYRFQCDVHPQTMVGVLVVK